MVTEFVVELVNHRSQAPPWRGAPQGSLTHPFHSPLDLGARRSCCGVFSRMRHITVR